ncbi:bifunctional hydroxymethylpyrimidine kinase/phosphomethylpyrimidine kinase [Sanguibacter suaedae]|uniref:Bifunctional hydroxymethylpyrimidine kinase/phosphomethylpyrimidine kinase n=1 Tax=Sanguibacter suaedae TaxID=2795737 RepID=A0A934ICU7_9MICO|nr:bifunctional hydroxymethylpyrimidine kinase/phosphomethylpyrimidine kinase [Sanguibacter suaedae]MBI9115425.1 bifunctional hydroxymethylpyrimidine kinase/phosphomethylpyrimidine kinase [Sanguibacter suaedae]
MTPPCTAQDAPPGSRPRVLSIAGTDPTGGAGIHADLKSFSAHGAYGMAVVTAVVAQNTRGVRSVHVPPPDVLAAQLDTVSDDVALDAVKIGMVGSAENGDVVRAWLDRVDAPLVVLDPVMVSTSGHSLLQPDAGPSLEALVHRVHLVTPNLPELAALVGRPEARDLDEAVAQGEELQGRSGTDVLVTGGHLDGASCTDVLVTAAGTSVVPGPRVATTSTHGTGCSLSAALAALRPRCGSWGAALAVARPWLRGALEAADALRVGQGRGPVDHLHACVPSSTLTGWPVRRDARVAEGGRPGAVLAEAVQE